MQMLDLRLGHVLDVLAQLKTEGKKVRCVVTSPPYWGLRAYGTNPQIWQNGHELCEGAHAWTEGEGAKPRASRDSYALDNSPKQKSNKGSLNVGATKANAARDPNVCAADGAMHEWNAESLPFDKRGSPHGVAKSGLRGGSVNADEAWVKKASVKAENSTCAVCGAWRGELGAEPTPELYVEHIVQIFRAVREVLHDDGTVFLNLGDSYAGGGRGSGYSKKQDSNRGTVGMPKSIVPNGVKPKDLVGIPWRVAFALQADGWYLRSDIIWHKPNPMPESVTDRPTKAHEYIFLLAKSPRYFYDADAVREPMSEATKARDRYKFSGVFKGQFRGTPDENRWQDGRPLDDPHFYNENGRNRRSVWSDASAAPGDPNASFARFAEWVTKRLVETDAAGYKALVQEYIAAQDAQTDVWRINLAPYRGAHFATYPPKLVEPCVLAGTSARGQCPKCGKAWTRVVKVAARIRHESERQTIAARGAGGDRSKHARPPERVFEGWQPTCKCGLEPIPDVVLDIFNGSGTTAQVALTNGRSYIGSELNPTYLELARERLRKAGLLDAAGELIPHEPKRANDWTPLPGFETVGA